MLTNASSSQTAQNSVMSSQPQAERVQELWNEFVICNNRQVELAADTERAKENLAEVEKNAAALKAQGIQGSDERSAEQKEALEQYGIAEAEQTLADIRCHELYRAFRAAAEKLELSGLANEEASPSTTADTPAVE